jgi:hypothetical protein
MILMSAQRIVRVWKKSLSVKPCSLSSRRYVFVNKWKDKKLKPRPKKAITNVDMTGDFWKFQIWDKINSARSSQKIRKTRLEANSIVGVTLVFMSDGFALQLLWH